MSSVHIRPRINICSTLLAAVDIMNEGIVLPPDLDVLSSRWIGVLIYPDDRLIFTLRCLKKAVHTLEVNCGSKSDTISSQLCSFAALNELCSVGQKSRPPEPVSEKMCRGRGVTRAGLGVYLREESLTKRLRYTSEFGWTFSGRWSLVIQLFDLGHDIPLHWGQKQVLRDNVIMDSCLSCLLCLERERERQL